MKFVCPQNQLNTHLSLVNRAIPSRPTHPILANVLVHVDEHTQQVRLIGFDLSLGIQTSFAAEVAEGGTLTLPAKLLNDIVSRLPDDSVTVDEGATAFVTLTSASGRYQVRGLDAAEYPELPEIESQEPVYLPPDALLEGLRGSLFAASADETKQVLTGVHLTVQPEGLEFAATDGHRLAVVKVQDSQENGALTAQVANLEVTVPARALREVERILGLRQSLDPLALSLEQGQVVFQWGEQRLTSRTLEGQYPTYRQLIPQQFERQVTIDRRALLSALERIAVLADQRNSIVKFSMDADTQQVTISVDAQDLGSGQEAIPAQISGDSLDIAFNVKYLTDGLKIFNTADVQIQLNSAVSPVVLNPLGGSKLTYLVMPVQLRG
jgi:DNA polymerase III subunit beta